MLLALMMDGDGKGDDDIDEDDVDDGGGGGEKVTAITMIMMMMMMRRRRRRRRRKAISYCPMMKDVQQAQDMDRKDNDTQMVSHCPLAPLLDSLSLSLSVSCPPESDIQPHGA